ncbi:hypothetical protein GCM10007923_55550 [Shinella yambaruensis]|uniref:Uncharacterized protein n=1 Tax=Shinella yambaruensis TaxID=415996 RepID=A0ABQ5ZNW3_9HYPH|nr:hypothetical protein GCM10007923_55550 [Shinella yambaruensis]
MVRMYEPLALLPNGIGNRAGRSEIFMDYAPQLGKGTAKRYGEWVAGPASGRHERLSGCRCCRAHLRLVRP